MISLMIVTVDMIIIISLIVTADMLDMRFRWWLWQLTW